MKAQVFTGGDDGMVQAVNNWCESRVSEYRARSLYLPTGSTPVALYKAWDKQNPAFLKGLTLGQLDEVISGPQTGVFARFFKESLPSFANQFIAFSEAKAAPDLVILGIGMNGHVAFHEPGYPRDLFRGIVTVADEDCDAMKMPRETKADTFGTASFMQSKAILLLARGASKKALLQKLFNDPQADFPAAYLRDHPDFTVLMDADANPDNKPSSI
jgi:6-phosphogluconolactonase/glucosamine-6-phosphate isomerase/deaminase